METVDWQREAIEANPLLALALTSDACSVEVDAEMELSDSVDKKDDDKEEE